MTDVTVIVPVYNGENYLRSCFDALVKQNCRSFEVLVVNDGSTDHSQVVIDEYLRREPALFRCIRKANGGYGSAIRTGVRACHSDYFLICDADDTLMPECVSTLLSKARMSGADIVIGARMDQGLDGKLRYDACYDKNKGSLKCDDVYHRNTGEYSDLFRIDPRSQAKLYRRKITEGFRYPSKVGYADHILFYLSLLKADKVIYTDQPLSVYRVRQLENAEDRYAQLSGHIIAYKRMLTQAENMSHVPDRFYGMMYLMFNEMVDSISHEDLPAEDKKELMHSLKQYLVKLSAHARSIRASLSDADQSLSEKIRMEALFVKASRDAVYAILVNSAASDKKDKEEKE
jgi:glycosyltransferase involved in cell wall biosynthesis